MDYRGFSNMKGFQQFRAACRNGDERYGDPSYGLVEKTENLLLSDCAKEPLYARAYKYLNMLDLEFERYRNGSLESLGEDRTRPILDKALSWATQNYAGWDLYRHLRDELGMSNEEISAPGLNWMSSTRVRCRRTMWNMSRRMTMRKNYDTPSLPEHCYAVLPNSGQLIEVRRGEMGYYPCAYSTGGRAYNQVLENYFNAHEGISKAQAAAMLAGSMFGWSVPAAVPVPIRSGRRAGPTGCAEGPAPVPAISV